jgi:hypothetical protein
MLEGLYGQRAKDGAPQTRNIDGTSHPVLTNADASNPVSVILAASVAKRLGVPLITPVLSAPQTLGALFESCTREYVDSALDLLAHLQIKRLRTATGPISGFAQYAHLAAVQHLVEDDPELETAFGGDYLVKPDILVGFDALTNTELNSRRTLLTPNNATLTPIRATNGSLPLLHATISCKWTMRGDRAQNTRLEALNLIRNRKGRLPHIVVVTMECDPRILASLCLGTGDIDCVYHGGLYELIETTEATAESLNGKRWTAVRQILTRMVDGSRLRDISDLPLDLLG